MTNHFVYARDVLRGTSMSNSIKALIAIALVLAWKTTGAVAAEAEWNRTVLPRPPQPFQGVTKRSLERSVAAFTQPVKAPPNAPNILLALIADPGLGNPSTCGGPATTPALGKSS